jgi:hypothetical protein
MAARQKAAPRTFTFPNITSSNYSDDDDDDDGHPAPHPVVHAPFDLDDTDAPLTPHLPSELRNLETFYNPKPDGLSNFELVEKQNVLP